ncbi:MAG: gliding motility-associated C-terminal domain-containing protein [Bacteroidota bacterium]
MTSLYRRLLTFVISLSMLVGYMTCEGQNPDEIYVSTECNEIYRVDVKNCTAELVLQNSIQFLDIAINPIDKLLYGVDQNNALWRMNPFTQATSRIGRTSIGTNALTFSSQGILYGMSGLSSSLYSINVQTGESTILGSISEQIFSAGDLNFYRGDLYMFATQRRVVKINLEDIPNSRVVSFIGLQDVFGATSAGCDSRFYVSSDLNLYEVRDANFLRPDTICSNIVPCTIFGATSLVESVGELDLGPDKDLCVGDEIILYANADADTYRWQDGSTRSSFKVTETGTYWVEVSNVCGTFGDTIDVVFNEFPEVEITGDLTYCEGRTTTLTAIANDESVSLIWSNGKTEPVIEINSPGAYSVIAGANNCFTSDDVEVSEEFCLTILELPNVFTPNDDESNEEFIPIRIEEVKSMTTYIFDRTGNKIFETEKLAIRWDGKLPNGSNASDGVYFWWIKYTNFLEETKERRGTVTLMR